MTRSRAVVVCVLASLALNSWAAEGRSHSRTPRYRPPSMPRYQGRVLPLPHASSHAANQPRPSRPSVPAHSAPVARPAQPSRSVTPSAPVNRGAAPSLHAAGNFRPPARDGSGSAISARPLLDVTKKTDLLHHTVADPAFGRNAQSLSGSERDGKYHWHDAGGIHYSHWHDGAHDRDWFGFYQGRAYFWTTYYRGHFWWREPLSGRYLVYWNDHWWWHAPEGVNYVYIDQQYYQWLPNQNGASLVPLASQAPASSGGGEGLVVSSRPEFDYSADGTRMVQIEGEKLSAYLYNASPAERDGTKPLKFLGDGVTAVAFTDTSKGEPLKIVLTIQDPDGSVRTVVVDGNGEALNSPPPSPAPPAYGTPGAPGFDAPPDDLPPTEAPFPDGQ